MPGLTPLFGHFTPSQRSLFKGFGTDAADVAMTTGSIVEDLGVVEDIGTGEIAGLIEAFADTFLLQTAEEGLHHGIVPAITTPAHAGLQIVLSAEAPLALAARLCPWSK